MVGMHELLRPTSQICNMYIPVVFRIYKSYETLSDESFELTLAYPAYR
jgi:hypothetical protein